jgi:hypothetical protein
VVSELPELSEVSSLSVTKAVSGLRAFCIGGVRALIGVVGWKCKFALLKSGKIQ